MVAIKEEAVPDTSSRVLEEYFGRVVEDARVVAAGGMPSDAQGPFGEDIEIPVFELLRASGVTAESLDVARRADERLHEILLGRMSRVDDEGFIESATMLLYGYLFGLYDDEDFRFVYRVTLTSGLSRARVETWLKRAIVTIAASHVADTRQLMSEVRSWIGFLGTPLWPPAEFLEPCRELGIEIGDLLREEDYRLVSTLRKYTSYLEEALTDKTYQEVRALSREWLPDAVSSKILDIYKERVLGEAQKRLTSDMDIETAFKTVYQYFEEAGFKTHDGSVLPVRLQDLPEPPPPDVLEPVIFEMIPQKLRVELMPAVVYATKTKRIEILFLGGPRIGHSGILIKTDTGGILMDYGLSVANQRIPNWEPELEMVDTVLISHAHLDHIGGLPVLYDKFEGKWCSTGMTAAITRLLLEDALNVGTPLPPRKKDRTDLVSRFTKKNIDRVIQNHVKLEIGHSSEVAGGIVVTPIDASHIPGSVAYLVDIEGVRILYTGDFNLDKSVILPGANLPVDPDYVIFDGTYWGREDFDRSRVYHQMDDIVRNHGPIIIPAFAVGRAQEMLMILEEMGVTQSRNVIVAGLAEKVTKMAGYSGHWEGMKKNKVVLEWEDILVSGGGMMNGGLAREHFEQHRDNQNAAVVLCGYLAPRTPGWNLLHGLEHHGCRVEYARLSAHSSASRLQGYAHSCTGKKIMVHTPLVKEPRGVHIPAPSERIIIEL
ncbi:MAG: MBL fold metallo-hydrolase [Candidatus Thorarchaeota archaeon]